MSYLSVESINITTITTINNGKCHEEQISINNYMSTGRFNLKWGWNIDEGWMGMYLNFRVCLYHVFHLHPTP